MPEEQHTRYQLDKDLFSWTAPARPFKRRDREFYITVLVIVAIVGLVVFLVEGWMPVILLVSLVFLYYILSTVEPENIEYRITTGGIKIAQDKVGWDSLIRFWFSRRFNNQLVIFEIPTIPGRMELVINTEDKNKIRDILNDYIPEEEAPPSFLDKSANWVGSKLPGNK